MASKRDLLKQQAQKNEANRGAESVLSTHSTEKPSEIIDDGLNTQKPDLAPIKQATTSNPTEANISHEASKPNTTNKTSNPQKKGETLLKKYTGPDKNLGMRLVSQEDIDFLNFYPLQLGLTKKDYFNQIMAKAIDDANRKTINLNDEMIKQFMKGGRAELTTKNVTIAVPEDMIVEMKKAGAKHRMIIQRYIAYVVYKARTEATDFE